MDFNHDINSPPLTSKLAPNIILIVSKKYDWEELLSGKEVFENVIRIKNVANVEKLPFYKEGKWWVQGLSSS